MQYVIDDEYEFDLDISLKPLPIAEVEVVLPLLSIEKTPDIYRGKMLNGGATMVNGKAPAGSSIYDQVWTVVYHYLDYLGNITGEDTLVNVRWSDI